MHQHLLYQPITEVSLRSPEKERRLSSTSLCPWSRRSLFSKREYLPDELYAERAWAFGCTDGGLFISPDHERFPWEADSRAWHMSDQSHTHTPTHTNTHTNAHAHNAPSLTNLALTKAL
eukprot:1147599-Pelagomonas_calceolata.AAC.1